MKIRGKKLNAAQRKILTHNGINNMDDYLYVRTDVATDAGARHLDQHSRKIQSIVIVNRETGAIEKYPMEV